MQNSQCRMTGFDLADTVRLLDLPKSCQAILADCANLAGSTDAYFVCKSHRTIADETGYSRSTVLRAMKEAVGWGAEAEPLPFHEGFSGLCLWSESDAESQQTEIHLSAEKGERNIV